MIREAEIAVFVLAYVIMLGAWLLIAQLTGG